MKKSVLILLASSLLLTGCFASQSKSKRSKSSSTTETSKPTSGTSGSSKSSGGSTSSTSSSSGGSSTSSSSSSTSSSQPDPEVIDLGKQKISYIREYIASHPIDIPSGKIGAVNYKVKVTFEGGVIERTDLVKTKASFGCDVPERARVFLADETGYIGVASNVGDGTLYKKVADYVGDADSKYTITGYISTYLGHPEVLPITYELDKTLPVTYNPSTLADAQLAISNFWNTTKDITYNCAGHGYGSFYKIPSATCYYSESDGQRTDIYYFTDGEHLLKAIAHNRVSIVVGKVYNLYGIASILNYSSSLLIVGADLLSSEIAAEIDLTAAQNEPINTLRTVKASQDDTNTRYPNYTLFWGGLYKTTGYLTSCIEDGKYYIGIRDEYYSGSSEIQGKLNAQTTYKMALIDNDNFWNETWEQIEGYNPYADYINVNTPVEVYYIPQQLDYQSGNTAWKIFLLPSTFPMVY